jgi:hypothetical protein
MWRIVSPISAVTPPDLATLSWHHTGRKSSAVPAGNHHPLCVADNRVRCVESDVAALPHSLGQHFLNGSPQPGTIVTFGVVVC